MASSNYEQVMRQKGTELKKGMNWRYTLDRLLKNDFVIKKYLRIMVIHQKLILSDLHIFYQILLPNWNELNWIKFKPNLNLEFLVLFNLKLLFHHLDRTNLYLIINSISWSGWVKCMLWFASKCCMETFGPRNCLSNSGCELRIFECRSPQIIVISVTMSFAFCVNSSQFARYQSIACL